MTKVIHGDCIKEMASIEENSIDLVVTSPPYNVGLDYDEYNDDLDIKEYSDFIKVVFSRIDKIMKDTGRVCINHSLKNDGGIIDLPSLIKKKALDIGWDQRFEIIWDKGQSESSSAWGSWRSPSSPRPIFNHEYILIFDVSDKKRNSETVISKNEFMDLVKSVWKVKPKTNSEHPAAFPVEIPERLIKLNSYKGDTVLDPFSGSGSTLVACEKLNRKGVGIEMSKKYISLTKQRLLSVDDGKEKNNKNSVFSY